MAREPEGIRPVTYLIKATVNWTSHFLQGTRNTRPCLTGHPKEIFLGHTLKKKPQNKRKKSTIFSGQK